MSAAPDCRHARLHIGAAPQHLPPEVTSHIATCADCSRFRDETLALDGRVRSALEVPLPRFRERAPPARPWHDDSRWPHPWCSRCWWPAASGS